MGPKSMNSKRHGRAALAAAVAPIAPPCFSSRDQWVEYVIACAIDQREGHLPGPLLIDGDKPVTFNPRFSFCADCHDRHAAQMAHKGRCQPQYLIRLFAPTAEPTPSQASKESA
jgi:formate-dependent nitrite reductase cytochrome c552 subunit